MFQLLLVYYDRNVDDTFTIMYALCNHVPLVLYRLQRRSMLRTVCYLDGSELSIGKVVITRL